MEASPFGRSGYGGHEEDKDQEEHEQKPDAMKHQGLLSVKIEKGRSSIETDASLRPSSSLDHHENLSSKAQQEERLIESARAEMGQVREENQRLKQHLDQIMRDYKTLQSQFLDTVKNENKTTSATVDNVVSTNNSGNCKTDKEYSELVSLSLGRGLSSVIDSKKDKFALIWNTDNVDEKKSSSGKEEDEDEGLRLGLDCKFEPSPTASSSFEEEKEEEAGAETLPTPSKALKTMRSGEDEASNSNPAKRARVSVRARCDTPTMNDGCQWRKYGQKIAKGNPCPRAYYRCTVAPSCPVRKQVQRCAEDMSILITTYEGTHNHPLPMSATAMASTTSAAARMLLSGSSSSSSQSHPVTDLHGLNFYLEQYPKPTMTRPSPFYFPTTSVSSSSSCPTITLDLTTSNQSSSSSSSHFTRFNPSSYSTLYPPARPNFSSSTSLSFNTINSSDQNPSSSPFSWPLSIPYGGLANGYGSSSSNNNIITSSLRNQPNNPLEQDTIAAATKAITADPIFQSALAAALKSIMNKGGGSGTGPGNHAAPQ